METNNVFLLNTKEVLWICEVCDMPHVRILPVLGVVYVSDWLELLQCGLTGLLQGVGSASVQFSENNMKEDEIVFRI